MAAGEAPEGGVRSGARTAERAPSAAESEGRALAASVRAIGGLFLAILALWTAAGLLDVLYAWAALPVPVGLAAFFALAILLARWGRARLGATLLVAGVWLASGAAVLLEGGIAAPGVSLYGIAILVAGLLLGGYAAATVALGSAAAAALLALLEAGGGMPPGAVRHTLLTTWWSEVTLFAGAGALLWTALARQRAARERLRESEQRLRLATTAAGLRVWDLDLRPEAAAAGSGAPGGGAPARRLRPAALLEGAHPEDRARVRAALCRHLESGAAFEEEYRLRGPGGAQRWMAVRARTERDPEGRVLRTIAVGQDVTARKEAEALGARLHRALDQTTDATLLLDARMRVLYANPAFDAILGLDTARLRGAPVERLAVGPRRSALLASVRACLRRDLPWRERHQIPTAEGETAVRDASFTPVRDGAGTLVGYVVMIRDVTREVRLEEELRRAQKLEAAGQLAGGVAHDFNNLLTVIRGFLTVLRETAGEDPALREPLDEMERAAERAGELTQQLLAFGRRQVTEPRRIDLNAAVVGAIGMLRRLVPENVEIDFAPGEGLAPVEIDPSQLQQALLSLAANARDAMPEGGRLRIATRPDPLGPPAARTAASPSPREGVLLVVSDTGVGMDAETRERVFEPFFTTKEPGRGTGLGLASVYGIVEQNGGTIALETRPGAGTTFRIRLPCAPLATGAEDPGAPAAALP